MNEDPSGIATGTVATMPPAPLAPLAPLVAQVLHDLRGPLNTIAGWAAILERPGPDPELGARASEAIRRATRMQARLLDEIGLLGMLIDAPPAGPESVLLAELLDAVAAALEDVAAPRNVRVAVAVPRQARVAVSASAARAFFWWLGHATAKIAPAAATLEFAGALLADGQVEVTIAAGPPAPLRRLSSGDPLAVLALHLAERAGVHLTFEKDEGTALARVRLDRPRG